MANEMSTPEFFAEWMKHNRQSDTVSRCLSVESGTNNDRQREPVRAVEHLRSGEWPPLVCAVIHRRPVESAWVYTLRLMTLGGGPGGGNDWIGRMLPAEGSKQVEREGNSNTTRRPTQ